LAYLPASLCDGPSQQDLASRAAQHPPTDQA